MSRRKSGGGATCECQGECNRSHTGPYPNRDGSTAAGSRYPTRLKLVGDRVLCAGCVEPYEPTKRWRYATPY